MSTRGYGGAHYGHDDYYGGAERVRFAAQVEIVIEAAARIQVPFRATALIQWSVQGGLESSIQFGASAEFALSSSGALQTAIWLRALAPITWSLQGKLLEIAEVSDLGLLSWSTSSATVLGEQDHQDVDEPEDAILHEIRALGLETSVGEPEDALARSLGVPVVARQVRGAGPRRLESP